MSEAQCWHAAEAWLDAGSSQLPYCALVMLRGTLSVMWLLDSYLKNKQTNKQPHHIKPKLKYLVFMRFVTSIAKAAVRKESSLSWQKSGVEMSLCYLCSGRVGCSKERGSEQEY